MPNMSWNQIVNKGKALTKREDNLGWAWGDLAVKAVDEIDGHGVEYAIQKLCYESGYEGCWKTVQVRYYTAKSWPPEKRVKGCSFKAHQVLNQNKNRFRILKPGMTAAKASDLVGKDIDRRVVELTTNDPILEMLEAARASASWLRRAETLLNAINVDNLNNHETDSMRDRVERILIRSEKMLD